MRANESESRLSPTTALPLQHLRMAVCGRWRRNSIQVQTSYRRQHEVSLGAFTPASMRSRTKDRTDWNRTDWRAGKGPGASAQGSGIPRRRSARPMRLSPGFSSFGSRSKRRLLPVAIVALTLIVAAALSRAWKASGDCSRRTCVAAASDCARAAGQRIVPRPGMSGRSSAVTHPGGSSFTYGTALRARSPVARHPAAAASRPLPSVKRKAVS